MRRPAGCRGRRWGARTRSSAERPNHAWALDFQFDQTADGRILKLLNIVDEHTREALAMVGARRINADATAATLDRIVAGRWTRACPPSLILRPERNATPFLLTTRRAGPSPGTKRPVGNPVTGRTSPDPC